MIVGIGVDTTTISRLAKSMQSEHFMQRVFGDAERAYFAQRAQRPQSVAAAFAAKEAFSKALGTGLSGFTWHEAQLLHHETGAPYFGFSGKLAQQMQGRYVHVSLTHEGDTATAFVVIETKEDAT